VVSRPPTCLRQHVCHLATGPVNKRFGRSLGNTKHFRDFCIRAAFLVSQDDCGPPGRPQSVERAAKCVAEVCQFNRIRRRRRCNVRRGEVVLPRIGIPPTKRIDRGVVGDPKNPAGEPAGSIEAGETSERLEEYFLRDVLGESGIADDPADQVEDRPLISPDNLLK
jgi:hypothetical protein